MSQPFKADLLDALVVPFKVRGAASPGELLRKLLVGESVAGARRRTVDRALLLGAVYLGVLSAIAADLGDATPKALPRRKRWDSTLQDKPLWVSVDRLVLPAFPSPKNPAPAFRTRTLLAGLPPSFVREVVDWAPPVVAPAGPDDTRITVLGNLIPGFLAKYRLPGECIHLRQVNSGSVARHGLADLIPAFVPPLANLVEQERTRIAMQAPNGRLGQLLLTFGETKVSRPRPRAPKSLGP